jgi:hypothetical protein
LRCGARNPSSVRRREKELLMMRAVLLRKIGEMFGTFLPARLYLGHFPILDKQA